MGTLRAIEPRDIPREELDRIAREGDGVLYQFSMGWDYCGQERYRLYDWEIRHIASRGCGNMGRLVLVPRSSRAWAHWFVGQARRVSELLGIDEQDAKIIIRGGKGIRFAHEEAVMRAAWDTCEDERWDSFDPCHIGNWVTEHWPFGHPVRALSCPRIKATHALVMGIRREAFERAKRQGKA